LFHLRFPLALPPGGLGGGGLPFFAPPGLGGGGGLPLPPLGFDGGGGRPALGFDGGGRPVVALGFGGGGRPVVTFLLRVGDRSGSLEALRGEPVSVMTRVQSNKQTKQTTFEKIKFNIVCAHNQPMLTFSQLNWNRFALIHWCGWHVQIYRVLNNIWDDMN
jgi:hypothetical protein